MARYKVGPTEFWDRDEPIYSGEDEEDKKWFDEKGFPQTRDLGEKPSHWRDDWHDWESKRIVPNYFPMGGSRWFVVDSVCVISFIEVLIRREQKSLEIRAKCVARKIARFDVGAVVVAKFPRLLASRLSNVLKDRNSRDGALVQSTRSSNL